MRVSELLESIQTRSEDGVITELNKIVADHPDESYVIFLRGFFYVAKTEFKRYDKVDLEAGIRDFDKTIQLNARHVSAYIYRGFLYYKAALITQGALPLVVYNTRAICALSAY